MASREAFLRSQKLLRLATVDAAGAPRVTPVWYMYRGGRIYVGTGLRTGKARDLRRGGRAAFCVDAGASAPGIEGVAGRGRARLIRDAREVRRLGRAILRRYFASLDGPAARQLIEETDCIIEVTPDSWSRWSY